MNSITPEVTLIYPESRNVYDDYRFSDRKFQTVNLHKALLHDYQCTTVLSMACCNDKRESMKVDNIKETFLFANCFLLDLDFCKELFPVRPSPDEVKEFLAQDAAFYNNWCCLYATKGKGYRVVYQYNENITDYNEFNALVKHDGILFKHLKNLVSPKYKLWINPKTYDGVIDSASYETNRLMCPPHVKFTEVDMNPTTIKFFESRFETFVDISGFKKQANEIALINKKQEYLQKLKNNIDQQTSKQLASIAKHKNIEYLDEYSEECLKTWLYSNGYRYGKCSCCNLNGWVCPLCKKESGYDNPTHSCQLTQRNGKWKIGCFHKNSHKGKTMLSTVKSLAWLKKEKEI